MRRRWGGDERVAVAPSGERQRHACVRTKSGDAPPNTSTTRARGEVRGGSLDFQIFARVRTFSYRWSRFFVPTLFFLTFVTQERRFSDANTWNPPAFWRPVAFLPPSCCRDAGGKSTHSAAARQLKLFSKQGRRPPLRRAIVDPRGRRSHGGAARGERGPSERRRRDSSATRGAALPTGGGARAGGRHGERGALPDGVGGGAVGAERRGAARGGADADRGTSPARSRASGCVVVRSIRGGANAPGDRPPAASIGDP